MRRAKRIVRHLNSNLFRMVACIVIGSHMIRQVMVRMRGWHWGVSESTRRCPIENESNRENIYQEPAKTVVHELLLS